MKVANVNFNVLLFQNSLNNIDATECWRTK